MHIRPKKNMCVSGYMKLKIRDCRLENIFICLKVFTWGRLGNKMADLGNPLEIPKICLKTLRIGAKN